MGKKEQITGQKRVTVPKLTCLGCINRDRIVKSLAARIDEQDKLLKNAEKSDLKKAA